MLLNRIFIHPFARRVELRALRQQVLASNDVTLHNRAALQPQQQITAPADIALQNLSPDPYEGAEKGANDSDVSELVECPEPCPTLPPVAHMV